ncbi:hypothetical protein F5X99DRAFT_400112 [Biscogniauxia marginata]|nr:hypothetical protein F5X99DRAFT_400112 [Biscogniauxia marginata]
MHEYLTLRHLTTHTCPTPRVASHQQDPGDRWRERSPIHLLNRTPRPSITLQVGERSYISGMSAVASALIKVPYPPTPLPFRPLLLIQFTPVGVYPMVGYLVSPYLHFARRLVVFDQRQTVLHTYIKRRILEDGDYTWSTSSLPLSSLVGVSLFFGGIQQDWA